MVDEETDEERKIVASSFCDPYILLIKDDNTSMVLKLDKKGELDEVEGTDTFKASEWISGCIHQQIEAQHPLIYLLNAKGTMNVRHYFVWLLRDIDMFLDLPTSGFEWTSLCYGPAQFAY